MPSIQKWKHLSNKDKDLRIWSNRTSETVDFSQLVQSRYIYQTWVFDRIELFEIHPTFDKHSKLDIFIQLENLITKTSNQNWIYLLNLSIWSHRTSESDDDEKFEKILNLSLVRSSREGKTRGSFKIIIIWVPKIIFWAPLRFFLGFQRLLLGFQSMNLWGLKK